MKSTKGRGQTQLIQAEATPGESVVLWWGAVAVPAIASSVDGVGAAYRPRVALEGGVTRGGSAKLQ